MGEDGSRPSFWEVFAWIHGVVLQNQGWARLFSSQKTLAYCVLDTSTQRLPLGQLITRQQMAVQPNVHSSFFWEHQKKHLYFLWELIPHPLWIHRVLCCCPLVTKSCPHLCDPRTTAHQASLSVTISLSLLKLTSTVGDAIQPSHPLLTPSPFTLNLSQHQGLFQWMSSSYQVAKPEAALGLTSRNWPSPRPWQFIQRWTSDQGGLVRVNLGAWLKLVGKRSYLCYSGYKLGASELHCCGLIIREGSQPRGKWK